MNVQIAIIGTGRVGATVAYTLIIKDLVSKLILVDANLERCEGELRDLADVLAFSATKDVIQGTMIDARAADIIIITAGLAQAGPQETRVDLAKKNAAIVQSIVSQLCPVNPKAVVLVVTNPVDLMTQVAQETCNLPRERVFGTGTWLDTQRLRRYLGQELDVAPDSIDAFVVGEHGDSQSVAWSQAHVGGQSIVETGIDQKTLDAVAYRTAHEAYDIIQKKCATYYGIAACVADLCKMIIFDQKEVVPVSCYNPDLGVCISSPVILGSAGVERQLLLDFSPQERERIRKSAADLREVFKSIRETLATPT